MKGKWGPHLKGKSEVEITFYESVVIPLSFPLSISMLPQGPSVCSLFFFPPFFPLKACFWERTFSKDQIQTYNW